MRQIYMDDELIIERKSVFFNFAKLILNSWETEQVSLFGESLTTNMSIEKKMDEPMENKR